LPDLLWHWKQSNNAAGSTLSEAPIPAVSRLWGHWEDVATPYPAYEAKTRQNRHG